MNAHVQLSILDYNSNVGRSQALSPNGEEVFRYVFPKATGEWVAKPTFDKKNRNWHLEILQAVVERVHSGVRDKVEIPESVPGNIAKKPCPDKNVLRRNALVQDRLINV